SGRAMSRRASESAGDALVAAESTAHRGGAEASVGSLPAEDPWDPGQGPTSTRPAFRPTLHRAVFGAAVVVQLLVLYLPRVPSTGGMQVPGSDKAMHALVFALVMLTGILAGLNAKWLAVILVAHAVLSEVVQYTLLPHRTGDPLDAVADLAGILL